MAVWTLQTTGLTGDILHGAVAYSGTVIIAGTQTDELATSPDGVTWTLQASPFGGLVFPSICTIAWSPDLATFCALAVDQNDQTLWSATSPDGVTWSAASQVLTGAWASPPIGLAWGNGTFLISGQYLGGGADTATSPDGVTWTGQSDTVGFLSGAIAFDGSNFLCGTNGGGTLYLISTPDGVTWTTYSATGFSGTVQTLGFNASGSGPLTGLYIGTDANALTETSTVLDFSTATVTTPGLGGGVIDFAFDGLASGNLLAAGQTSGTDTRVTATVDGVTWGALEDPLLTMAPVTGGNTVGGVLYAFGQFFAYGNTGAVSLRGGGPPPATVPDVTNTSEAIAEDTIVAAGYVVGVVTFAPSVLVIPGNVVSQSPIGGTIADLGTPVDLVISTGRAALLVPDLIGLTQPQAVALLLSVGLVPGAQSIAPSQFVESGFVFAQNPTAGQPIASGFFVSFVISSGPPRANTAFDFESTVISQYANSPTILQLAANMNAYIDQTADFAAFYTFVWNVDTAVGFGLDIWGKIVDVSRLLHIPNTTLYVGFDNSATPPPDWQSMGSDQDNPPVGGAMYTGHNATQTYLLGDDAYRQLILAKAFANIAATTAPAINQILQNLYGVGAAWVLNTGPMAISYNLNFTPSAIQLAILEQSGVIPTPPGVAVTIVSP